MGNESWIYFRAVGSAVGLGNIWRFPYTAYENGGGAFFLPYLFALLTTGISLLAFEFALGHRHRGSAPLTFFRISPRAEFIGWWQMCVTFIVSTYYAVIIAWSISYTYFAITGAWGKDTQSFYLKSTYMLQISQDNLEDLYRSINSVSSRLDYCAWRCI